ncbi:MAG: hypothetical protein Aurels2KO_23080 [Aureliella sp.]
MSRLISFAVLIAIIIAIGLLFYKVLVGFFVPVFLAAVLVVVFRPLHRWVLQQTGQREQLAAALTTMLIVAALVLPFGVVFSSAAVQGVRLIQNNDVSVLKLRRDMLLSSLGLTMPAYESDLRKLESAVTAIVNNTKNFEPEVDLARVGQQAVGTLTNLETKVVGEVTEGAFKKDKLDVQFESLRLLLSDVGVMDEDSEFDAPSRLALQIKSQFGSLKEKLLGGPVKSIAREWANPNDETVEAMREKVVAYVQPRLLAVTGATGAFVVKLVFGSVILVVATFFFLYDGPAMIKAVMDLSPLDDTYEQELLLEFDRISRAVVLATLLSAITQGITAGIGYYFVGMDFLVLLIMLTTVFAMVPFVGPAVVWLPVCLYVGIYDGRVLAASLLALWGIGVVGTIDNLVKAFVLHGQSQLHPLLALLSVLGGVQTLGPVGIVVGPMVVAILQTLLSILQRELLHFDKQEIVVSTEGKRTGARRRKSFAHEDLDDGDRNASENAVREDGESEAEEERRNAAAEDRAGSEVAERQQLDAKATPKAKGWKAKRRSRRGRK